MSYPDQQGGPTSREGHPPQETTGHWARHGGAAPDAYAGDPAHAGAAWQPDGWAPPPAYPAAGDESTWNAPAAAPEGVARGGPGRRRADRSGRPVGAAPRTSRAGRNLCAAVVVGVSLGAVIL